MIEYDSTTIKHYKVRSKVLFEVDVETEVPVEHFIDRGGHTGVPVFDPNSIIKLGIVDEAKRKVETGNCNATLVGLQVQILP